jgi:hypothetical protein
VGPGPRLVDGLELLAWIINRAEGPPSPARGRRRQLTQRNRLWSVTDAFQPAVHRPGRRGIQHRPGTRTDRRGTHQPGWEGIALRSYVRSIDPVEGRKIIGRAPLIVTPIRKPTALWAGHLMRELGPRMSTPWATTATRSAECFALRRCRWRRLQHWSADRNLRPLIEARPICRHASITGTRRACMSLVIENDGVADEPTPLVFLHCRAATEFEP